MVLPTRTARFMTVFLRGRSVDERGCIYFVVFAFFFFVRAAAAALLAFTARAFRWAAVMFAAARFPPLAP
jgi:hypothetical protein